jgi:hypothetical protein
MSRIKCVLGVFAVLIVVVVFCIINVIPGESLSPEDLDESARRNLQACAGILAVGEVIKSTKYRSALMKGEAGCDLIMKGTSPLVNSKIKVLSPTRYQVTGKSRTGKVFSIDTDTFVVVPKSN